MATITVSNFFVVGGVADVFVRGEVTEFDGDVPSKVQFVDARKHGVTIEVSDKEKDLFAGMLLMNARRAYAPAERDEYEPEDFNDRYDAVRSRWGHD
jgi:hypothetical protein